MRNQRSRLLLMLFLPVVLVGAFLLTSPTPARAQTPTPTATATPTSTPTPPATFTWAESSIEPVTGITDALAVLLTNDPPANTTTLWAITDAAASNSGWYISLASLAGVPSPYDVWNVMDNGIWMGAAECIESGTWSCDYYEPTLLQGGGAGLVFPWRSGQSAIYGPYGVHEAGWGGIQYAVDFFPQDSETVAVEAGTSVWTCSGTYNKGVIIRGAEGDFLYLHLEIATPLTVGDAYTQGQLIGSLVHGTFSYDGCGTATQQPNNAHVHFGFDSADNYFSIGGCVLDIAAQTWDCNGTDIGAPGTLLNTGSASGNVPTDPTNDGAYDPGSTVQIWED
jgi:hypothetical protein